MRISGFGFRVSGFGFRVLKGFMLRVSGTCLGRCNSHIGKGINVTDDAIDPTSVTQHL